MIGQRFQGIDPVTGDHVSGKYWAKLVLARLVVYIRIVIILTVILMAEEVI